MKPVIHPIVTVLCLGAQSGKLRKVPPLLTRARQQRRRAAAAASTPSRTTI